LCSRAFYTFLLELMGSSLVILYTLHWKETDFTTKDAPWYYIMEGPIFYVFSLGNNYHREVKIVFKALQT
jgi:hypothetical protein